MSATIDGSRFLTRLADVATTAVWADSTYHWSLKIRQPDGVLDCRRLHDGTVPHEADVLQFGARIGGLTLEQRWVLSADEPWMDETIRLQNDGDGPVAVMGIEYGFLRDVADGVGPLDEGCDDERFVAFPFRKRPGFFAKEFQP